MSLNVYNSNQTILKGYSGEMTAELNALILSLQQDSSQELYYNGRRLQDTGTKNGVGIVLCPRGYDSFNSSLYPFYEETDGLRVFSCAEKYTIPGSENEFTREKLAGLQSNNSWLLPPEGKRIVSIGPINKNGERICKLQDMQTKGMKEWEDINAYDNSVYIRGYGWMSLDVNGVTKHTFKNIRETLGGYEFETETGVRQIIRKVDYLLAQQ